MTQSQITGLEGVRRSIDVSKIVPDYEQPRKNFDQKEMDLLEASIKNRGVLSPLILEDLEDGKFLIIDGERRYRTSISLKLEEVPAVVFPKTKNIFERNALRFHIQETHAHWTAFEKAEMLSYMQKEFECTVQELAVAVNIPAATVSRYLTIRAFSSRDKNLLIQYRLPITYAQKIANLMTIAEPEFLKKNKDIVEVLVKKYQSGMLANHNDVSRLTRYIREGKTKIVQNFLDDPKSTIKTIVSEDKDIRAEEFTKSLNTKVKALKFTVNLAITNKHMVQLKSSETELLIELRDLINELI